MYPTLVASRLSCILDAFQRVWTVARDSASGPGSCQAVKYKVSRCESFALSLAGDVARNRNRRLGCMYVSSELESLNACIFPPLGLPGAPNLASIRRATSGIDRDGCVCLTVRMPAPMIHCLLRTLCSGSQRNRWEPANICARWNWTRTGRRCGCM